MSTYRRLPLVSHLMSRKHHQPEETDLQFVNDITPDDTHGGQPCQNGSDGQIFLPSYHTEIPKGNRSGPDDIDPLTLTTAINTEEYEKGTGGIWSAETPISFNAFGEAPKRAIARGFRANLSLIYPHVIAIVVTLGVVQLSFREHYWMDLQSPTKKISPGLTQGGTLNVLQFAAKLHEMIILASASTIVMHCARSLLLGRAGLPFGLVASGFQLGSLDFLRRNAFWAAWKPRPLADANHSPFEAVPYIALFMVSALLVALAGPSAAIAVVPRLDYYNIARPFTTPLPNYYIFNRTLELWPSHLTKDDLPDIGANNSCTGTGTPNVNVCPAGDYYEIYKWCNTLLFLNTDLGANLSITSTRGDTRRVVNTKSCDSPFLGKASSFSVNTFVEGAMTSYLSYARNNLAGTALDAAQVQISLKDSSQLYAPRSDAICQAWDWNSSTVASETGMFFPMLGNPDLNIDTAPDALKIPESVWANKLGMNDTNFTFVEIPSIPGGPSIGGLFTVPTVTLESGNWSQHSEVVACSVYSQWVPIEAWYEPQTEDQVAYRLDEADSDSCLDISASSRSDRSSRNITISLDYAAAINMDQAYNDGVITSMDSFMSLFVAPSRLVPGANLFLSPSRGAATNETGLQVAQDRSRLLSTILSTVVTDALARAAGNGAYPYSAPMFLVDSSASNMTGLFPQSSQLVGQTVPLNSTTASAWPLLGLQVQRYGYGYRWHGSSTAQFGISILLIHLAMAVIHLLWICYKIVRREGISRAWDTNAELVALALNSKPSSRLRNTCAGIADGATWRETVAVRETYPGHLEMVIGEKKAMAQEGMVQAGKLYGSLRVDNDKQHEE